MENIRLLHDAYRLLNRVTPLSADCGQLCGSRCCQGTSRDGMWLLPGEEQLFAGNSTFAVIPGSGDGASLICEGTCIRRERPFACRIFPLFPFVSRNPDGFPIGISVKYDPRALRICPLAASGYPLPLRFRRAVRSAARILVQDPGTCTYLISVSRFLDDIGLLDYRLSANH